MKKGKKDIKKYNIIQNGIVPTVIILFFCCILIYLGLLLYNKDDKYIKNLPLFYRPICDFMNANFDGNQLTYIGSIIGGGITLLGVYLTINHENRIRKEDQLRHDQERREDLAIQYKPFISIVPQSTLKDRNIDINDFIKHNLKTHEYSFKITYQNIGRGEADNFRIKVICGKTKIYEYKDNVVTIFSDNLFHRFHFFINDENIKLKKENKLEVIFFYTDSFNMYHYEIHYQIKFTLKNEQCISYSLYTDHKSNKTEKINNKKL